MRKDERETKTVSLTIRIRPSTKEAAEKRAAQDDRSLASYIELLIRKDAGAK
jgi:predicted HicB family RNase H-like nuclease